jgi:hypothetical protein
MSAADDWAVDVLDSVMAEFGRSGTKPKSDPPKPVRVDETGRQLLDILFLRLFPDDLQAAVTTVVDRLAGETFGSLAENRRVVDRLNRILRGTDLSLVSELGTPVRLRLIKPARSENGYFQLRTADAHQKSVYSGAIFPPLRVEFDI